MIPDEGACLENKRLTQLFAKLTAEDGRCGWPPFRWQMRLLERLLEEDLPTVVDVATGLGKTSVMALWLIALSEGAQLPRRLVYIVDRRAVVDQATRFAEQLRRNMPDELADKLGLEENSDGLPISTLRGGFADNRDWLADPSRPSVIVGTIDMIGSRLLFEGYGVSRKMRPYHAGLLGVDSLVLLDEAHLCPPFECLLRQVVEHRHRDEEIGSGAATARHSPPFRLMSLSATGRDAKGTPSESVFRLGREDRDEPEVHRRLNARKRLGITELVDIRSLTENIADRAVDLGHGGDMPTRVLVYCSSRRDAIAVKARIDKECSRRRRAKESVGHTSELLVGERRVHERTKLENWLTTHGFLGGAGAPADAPTFLVATSAGEVGVDLDADHLVCDLVAYERMVQRLGRVNRRGGETRTAIVDVFWARPALKANAGKAQREKHNSHVQLIEQRLSPLRALPKGEDHRRDASPAAIMELKTAHPELVEAATTPAPLYPALSRPLLDAWSLTSLERHEGRPEVAPWLRGWQEEDEPQTVVAWRQHLPSVRSEDGLNVPPSMVSDYFRAAPIHATEKLEAVCSRVFDWLLKRVAQVAKRQDGHDFIVKDQEVAALLLDRAGECVRSATLSELKRLAAPARSMRREEVRERDRDKRDWKERHLPGALLVVHARIGGLRDGMLDEKSESIAIAADGDEHWQELREDVSSERPRPLIKFRVEPVSADQEETLSSPTESHGWHHVRTFETDLRANGTPQRGLAILKWHDDAEEEEARSILSAPQLLRDHAEQVAERTRQMACRLKLPQHEVEALTLAARLHDEGKAAKRWQTAMNAPKESGEPYAKTRGGGNVRLLEGYRHEFGSLIKAERENLPRHTCDLILHLIAAHHGNARPVISFEGCEYGPPSQLESRAGEAALRFARLQSEYGPWGLAWREAILRAADQSASRDWSRENQDRKHG